MHMHVTKMVKLSLIYTIIHLSIDDTRVLHQMAFISGQSLHQHIFKMLQLLRSSGNRQTDTQTDYYNSLPTLGLIMTK